MTTDITSHPLCVQDGSEDEHQNEEKDDMDNSNKPIFEFEFDNSYMDSLLDHMHVVDTSSYLHGQLYKPLFKNIHNFARFILPYLKVQSTKKPKINLRVEFKKHVSKLIDRHRIHKASTASNMEIYLMLTGQTIPDYYIQLLILYAYWDDWLDEGSDQEQKRLKFEWVRDMFLPACTKRKMNLDANVTDPPLEFTLPPLKDIQTLHYWIYRNPKRDDILPLLRNLIDCEINAIQPAHDHHGMKSRIYSAYYMLKAAQTVHPFFGTLYEIPHWPEHISILLSLLDDIFDMKQDKENGQWTYFNHEAIHKDPSILLLKLKECMPILYHCLHRILHDTMKDSYIDHMESYVFAYIHTCVYYILQDMYPSIADTYLQTWQTYMFPTEDHATVMDFRKTLVTLYSQLHV